MSVVTVDQAMQIATAHHRAGRLVDAETIYRQVLAQEPNHADALHLLGVIAHQSRRNELALELISRAIAIQPNKAHYYNNISMVLMEQNRAPEAAAACRTAIQLKRDYADAYVNLSHTLCSTGQLEEALECCRKAIEYRPNQFQAYVNLGCVLGRMGNPDDAIAAYDRAIALSPNHAVAHCNLGAAYHARDRIDDAIAAYQRAIALQPHYAEAFSNLGNALKDKGQFEEAMAAYRQSITLRPDYAEAHSNLGTVFQVNRQLDQAIDSFRAALRIKHELPEAHHGLGTALYKSGQFDDAIACFRTAIALRPDYADAHWNYALALLLTGNFEDGWREYEWRWSRKKLRKLKRDFTQPRWAGEDISGKTILVYCEQGFGDVLQFCRYLPLIQKRGAKIILECPRELVRSIDGALDLQQVVAPGEPLDDFDVQIPLLSLPFVFGTTLQTIPADVPYLHADPQRIEYWQERLRDDRDFKVGIAWAGRQTHPNDRNRSLSPEMLAPLAAVPGVHLYSLQKTDDASQARIQSSGLTPVDFTDELHDFADTAALIMNLDLIITVDTSVAHLAGALNKPVWTLLPFVPDWRWMLNRADSPWYPGMRLFRQTTMGDWASAINDASTSLAALSTNDQRI